METIYRIEYDDEKVISITLHIVNSITYSANRVIVDTLENARNMLNSINIDSTLMDYYM